MPDERATIAVLMALLLVAALCLWLLIFVPVAGAWPDAGPQTVQQSAWGLPVVDVCPDPLAVPTAFVVERGTAGVECAGGRVTLYAYGRCRDVTWDGALIERRPCVWLPVVYRSE